MHPPYPDTISKMHKSRNKFGENVYEAGDGDTFQGKFREIVGLSDTGKMEGLTADAMLWCPAGLVSENDIILARGQYYKVVRTVQATGIDSAVVEFTKNFLEKEKGL